MAVRGAMERVRLLDQAWNDRRWPDYAALLADDFIGYISPEAAGRTKDEYLQSMRMFCEKFPDSILHIKPYRVLFASHDGRHTCSMARLSGTASGSIELPGSPFPAMLARRFGVNATTICKWRDGAVLEQHRFIDVELIFRQLRGVEME